MIEGNGKTLFKSSSLSLRYHDRSAVENLSSMVQAALNEGFDPLSAPNLAWQGSKDDFHLTHNGIDAHVEHLDGPLRGGVWFASVGDFFSSEDIGCVPKTARTAKWLCELAIVNPGEVNAA